MVGNLEFSINYENIEKSTNNKELYFMHKGLSGGKAGRFVLAGLFAVFVLSSPVKCRSLELGLTPSHVYSLWHGINQSLLIYSQIISKDEDGFVKLKAMQPKAFENKIPADVYSHAEKVTSRLRGFISISTDVPGWLIEFEQISPLTDTKDEEITPSAVFLISTQILNSIVDVVVDNTDWEQPVSDLYAIDLRTDKAPSDVFGLVDLALRRTGIILAGYDN